MTFTKVRSPWSYDKKLSLKDFKSSRNSHFKVICRMLPFFKDGVNIKL